MWSKTTLEEAMEIETDSTSASSLVLFRKFLVI